MSPLLEVLFTYACENLSVRTKEDQVISTRNNQIAEQAQEEIMHLLSEEGQRRFDDYIHAENKLQLLELEAIFRAGISIGLELSQL